MPAALKAPLGPDGLPDVCAGCDAILGPDFTPLAAHLSSGRYCESCAPDTTSARVPRGGNDS